MVNLVENLNFVLMIFFTVCYSYQFFYAFYSLKKKPAEFKAKKLHSYAVVISARNESTVISHLIESIKKQNYPSELVDIYVVADNCTDDTAAVAKQAGAIVYERSNNKQRGKGYALDYIFKLIQSGENRDKYDGYMVFDADNLLDPDYISEMNKVFDNGYRVVTSYRNSKNYDTNWISSGYSLWFLREARYINNPRMMLGTSCAISGTGFLIHKDIIRQNGGWKHHLLTEDIEFTVDSVIHGEKIGYCAKAVVYDEQPSKFSQSWNQRLRWSKGFYQVFAKYGAKLFAGIFRKKGGFACYDLMMTIAPAAIVSIIGVFGNAAVLLYALCNVAVDPHLITAALFGIGGFFLNFYCILLFFGFLTLLTEWKKIRCKMWKKVVSLFTFPLFVFTYIPIAIVALFKKVEWTPISHTVAKTIDDVHGQ